MQIFFCTGWALKAFACNCLHLLDVVFDAYWFPNCIHRLTLSTLLDVMECEEALYVTSYLYLCPENTELSRHILLQSFHVPRLVKPHPFIHPSLLDVYHCYNNDDYDDDLGVTCRSFSSMGDHFSNVSTCRFCSNVHDLGWSMLHNLYETYCHQKQSRNDDRLHLLCLEYLDSPNNDAGYEKIFSFKVRT